MASGNASAAWRLGGKGTGEDTFNAPWDAPPLRGFQQHDVPRPWWAAAGSPSPAFASVGRGQGLAGTSFDSGASTAKTRTKTDSGPNASAPSSPSSSSSSGRPVKRDYQQGHQLDERYEEDKLQIAAKERRVLTIFGFAVVLGALMAAGRAVVA